MTDIWPPDCSQCSHHHFISPTLTGFSFLLSCVCFLRFFFVHHFHQSFFYLTYILVSFFSLLFLFWQLQSHILVPLHSSFFPLYIPHFSDIILMFPFTPNIMVWPLNTWNKSKTVTCKLHPAQLVPLAVSFTLVSFLNVFLNTTRWTRWT